MGGLGLADMTDRAGSSPQRGLSRATHTSHFSQNSHFLNMPIFSHPPVQSTHHTTPHASHHCLEPECRNLTHRPRPRRRCPSCAWTSCSPWPCPPCRCSSWRASSCRAPPPPAPPPPRFERRRRGAPQPQQRVREHIESTTPERLTSMTAVASPGHSPPPRSFLAVCQDSAAASPTVPASVSARLHASSSPRSARSRRAPNRSRTSASTAACACVFGGTNQRVEKSTLASASNQKLSTSARTSAACCRRLRTMVARHVVPVNCRRRRAPRCNATCRDYLQQGQEGGLRLLNPASASEFFTNQIQ